MSKLKKTQKEKKNPDPARHGAPARSRVHWKHWKLSRGQNKKRKLVQTDGLMIINGSIMRTECFQPPSGPLRHNFNGPDGSRRIQLRPTTPSNSISGQSSTQCPDTFPRPATRGRRRGRRSPRAEPLTHTGGGPSAAGPGHSPPSSAASHPAKKSVFEAAGGRRGPTAADERGRGGGAGSHRQPGRAS